MNYDELRSKLDSIEFDGTEVQLDKCTIIKDQEKFYKSHCATLDANRGNKRYKPYYDRLLKFYQYYEAKKRAI